MMAQTSIANGNMFLSLPLFKFSYATTAAIQGKLHWTHLPQRDNIYVVFDDVSSQDRQEGPFNRRLMKIVRGGETLVC